MKTVDIPFLLRTLKDRYPDVKTQLDHQTPFQLLTATILSAQCTDRQVNGVTPHLFKQFPTPRALAAASITAIEKVIRPTGFYHNKARNIQACARSLMERFDGIVPDALEDLVTLPGVGRKTANVVLSAAFERPAVVVDTHVKRIANRLGLTSHTDPVKIEFDLMETLPESAWNDFGLQLIYFGRSICKARKPECQSCPLSALCDWPHKTG